MRTHQRWESRQKGVRAYTWFKSMTRPFDCIANAVAWRRELRRKGNDDDEKKEVEKLRRDENAQCSMLRMSAVVWWTAITKIGKCIHDSTLLLVLLLLSVVHWQNDEEWRGKERKTKLLNWNTYTSADENGNRLASMTANKILISKNRFEKTAPFALRSNDSLVAFKQFSIEMFSGEHKISANTIRWTQAHQLERTKYPIEFSLSQIS